jgi:single-stranded-DNA-specific exonuclease
MSDASQLAVQLDAQNQKRRELEAEVVEQAGLQLEHKEEAAPAKRTIVVAGENWHQGVLGIVASRLARTHCKPAAVLTKTQDGLLIGSIRSVNGVNLIEALGQVDDCMESFGGHALAAGVSLKPENLEAFCELFESQVCAIASPETMLPELEICGEVDFSEIDGQFFHDLGLLAPFGHGYSEPVFAASDVYPERVAVVANGCHTRGRLRDATSRRSLDFIAFSKRPEDLPEPPWYLIYRPGLNTYKGRCKPQAEILDLCAMSDIAKPALCS